MRHVIKSIHVYRLVINSVKVYRRTICIGDLGIKLIHGKIGRPLGCIVIERYHKSVCGNGNVVLERGIHRCKNEVVAYLCDSAVLLTHNNKRITQIIFLGINNTVAVTCLENK